MFQTMVAIRRWWDDLDSDQLLFVSVTALISSAAFSGTVWLSATLGAIGVLAAVPAAWEARENFAARAAAGVGVFWLIFGAVVGSLPSPGDLSAVAAWIETEGRSLVVVGLIVAMCGLQRAATFDAILRAVVGLVALTSAASVVLHLAGVSFVGAGDLLTGFASSHHVPGFLASATILVVVTVPNLVSPRWLRVAVLVALFAAALLSGSRTSVLAAAICGLVLVVQQRGVRAVLVATAALVVVSALAIAGSSRMRETADIVISGELITDASDAFTDGTSARAVELASSESEANILIRFAIWGRTVDQFLESPIVGIGRYRVNDVESASTGVSHIVRVVTSAERRHNDEQPHNQYLYILAETGLIGLGLVMLPFREAWKWTRRQIDDPVDCENGREQYRVLSRLALLFSLLVGVASQGMLGTGAGLICVALVFGGARAYVLAEG